MSIEILKKLSEEDSWKILKSVMPSTPIKGWRLLAILMDGLVLQHDELSLRVILSVGLEEDGKTWLHFSLSHPDRLPTWEELRDISRMFWGEERMSIHVVPPKSKHVNLHSTAMHLWSCVDGPTIPDFTRGSGMI